MRYTVILKSGVKIIVENMTKEEVSSIRNMPDNAIPDGTIGFGTDGTFVQRSEIAAIVNIINIVKEPKIMKCKKCNGTGQEKLFVGGIRLQYDICDNCGGTGVKVR